MRFSSVQWFGGFYSFWYPGAAPATRAWFVPYHAAFGLYIYTLGLTTASLGILEKLTFLQTGGALGRRAPETILANFLGVVIVVLGGLVVGLAPRPKPRSPDPEQPEYRAIE
jgi:cytochrome b-561